MAGGRKLEEGGMSTRRSDRKSRYASMIMNVQGQSSLVHGGQHFKGSMEYKALFNHQWYEYP